MPKYLIMATNSNLDEHTQSTLPFYSSNVGAASLAHSLDFASPLVIFFDVISISDISQKSAIGFTNSLE